MQNVKIELQGNELVLRIDASQDLGKSKSGKSRMVATTGGNQPIMVAGKEVFLGLNAFTK